MMSTPAPASGLRLRSLGSGSTGNATLIESWCEGRASRLLVDAGFSLRQLEQRLARVGLQGEDIDAIFVTHEHSDHIGCAIGFAEKFNTPVWMSRGTHRAIAAPDCAQLRMIRDGEVLELGSLQVHPFTVPHDAQEPLQLRCGNGMTSLGVLTDLGFGSEHALSYLKDCATLLLECNHDTALLELSQYPPFLKNRIAGRLGHLPNEEAMRIVQYLRREGQLKTVVAAHLSERNNSPDLVRELLAQHLECAPDSITIACPKVGTDWVDCIA